MADAKTQVTDATPAEHFATLAPESRQQEARQLHDIFTAVTGESGDVWTGGIVGYGKYDYRYASGRTGTWMRTGFAMRKSAISIYLMSDLNSHAELLQQLGPHRTGASCLYIKRLGAVDLQVLQKLIAQSYEDMGCGNIDHRK